MPDRYLRIEEAADYLGFAVSTVYSWCCQRAIPFYRKRGRLRFSKEELDRWMEEDKKPEFDDPAGKGS